MIAGLTVGLDDLKGFFQLNQFYDGKVIAEIQERSLS